MDWGYFMQLSMHDCVNPPGCNRVASPNNISLYFAVFICMNEDIKPIKRSAQLAPLSREHHEGLLFVWKIRQGIKKDIHPERMIAFVNWFWQSELEVHFRKEEQVLIPLLLSREDLKNRLLHEHAHIVDSIEVARHNSYFETLENLAQAVNDHIRCEERVLFNEVERMVSSEELMIIGEQLRDEKRCGVWEDAFWEG